MSTPITALMEMRVSICDSGKPDLHSPPCVCVCPSQINSWQVSPFPVHVHEHTQEHTHTYILVRNTSWTGLIHSIKLYYPKWLEQMNEDSH